MEETNDFPYALFYYLCNYRHFNYLENGLIKLKNLPINDPIIPYKNTIRNGEHFHRSKDVFHHPND